MAVDGNEATIGRAPTLYRLAPGTLADGEYDVLHTDSAHRLLVSSTAISGSTDQNAVAYFAPAPTLWTATHVPAAATVATCGKAAGASGIKNVCTEVSFQLTADSTGGADLQTFVLRDGATGAGTILATWKVNMATGASIATTIYKFNGPWIGTAATAMTLETSSTPGTHTLASVNMTGYTFKP